LYLLGVRPFFFRKYPAHFRDAASQGRVFREEGQGNANFRWEKIKQASSARADKSRKNYQLQKSGADAGISELKKKSWLALERGGITLGNLGKGSIGRKCWGASLRDLVD